MKPYQVGLRVLRSAPVTAAARRFTEGKLRILAYHGVDDPESFGEQMECLARSYTPVSEHAVADALHRGGALPAGAAWVTFDDGDPSVVEHGLPVLRRLGIPATMFVCPGLIETGEPFWWRVTEWAAEARPDLAAAIGGAGDSTEHVKTIADPDRRAVIAGLLEAHDDANDTRPSSWRQLDDQEIAGWLEAGMALGNHSWDHPCLDRCDPEAQREQIRRTHGWLTDRLGRAPRSFAYPNGNFSDVVDAVVAELGYEIGVLYDNRLTALDSPPLQLSRLMLESHDAPERLRGVLSGAQPALASIAGRLRR